MPAHVSEHLANERTYLACVRSSVALISFGITLNRFSVYLAQSHAEAAAPRGRWILQDAESVGGGRVAVGLLLVIRALGSASLIRLFWLER